MGTVKARRRATTKQAKAAPSALTPAQLAGEERIPLPGGRWYYARQGEDGTPITDPAECEIWETGEDGRPVSWHSQAETAEVLGVSERWLRKLEDRGMPARGFRATCEYPWPHALLWYLEYQLSQARGEKVSRLDMNRVWAAHDRRCAIEMAEIEYKMKTDPLYRAWMEAEEANDYERAEELLRRLRARDGGAGR